MDVRSIARAAVAALAIGFVVAGCDRKTEPYVPGEQPEPPDLARIFPEAGRREAMPAAPSAAPGPSQAPVSPAASAPIRGRVELDPALGGRAPENAVLFVIARSQGATGGPPVAVQRIPQPRFPHAFEIGQADVMMTGMQFAGPLVLSARLDGDGNVMSRAPGDLAGEADGGLEPGSSGVVIVLGP